MDPLRIFRRFFPAGSDNAYHVYGALVAQARRPYFYAGLDVADTLDGRFDMILLHAALVLHRLNAADGDKSLAQDLVDVMFADLDRSLREMGVGDLAVPKRIAKLAADYNGRRTAYEAALGEGDEALAAALARNVYGRTDAAVGAPLARYVKQVEAALAEAPFAAFERGPIPFPAPEEQS